MREGTATWFAVASSVLAMQTRPQITYVEDFVSDHRQLFEQLTTEVVWDERMRARKTASFGAPYNYSGIDYPPVPFPEVLERLRARVEEWVGWAPNNCLLNLYEDGRSKMGMHADSVDGLEVGTAIVIVSLGTTRTIVFAAQTGGEQFSCPLHPGSVLLMPLALQGEWRHSIPAEERAGPRISATFRRMKLVF